MSKYFSAVKSKRSASPSNVRIIGGQFRSRKLNFMPVDGLRPTPDRVREMLFNWLQRDVVQAHCLDLFCGSGALGFEALSRDAASMTFVDNSPIAIEQISSNLKLLGISNAKIHTGDVLDWLSCQTGVESDQFDIVFLDPPYRKTMLAGAMRLIEKNNLLKYNNRVYVESEAELDLTTQISNSWALLKEKRTGQVVSRLYSLAV